MPRKSALLSATVETASAGGAKNKTIRDIKDYGKYHRRSAGVATTSIIELFDALHIKSVGL